MKFAFLTAAILIAFAYSERQGLTLGGPDQRAPTAPASVRNSPGGYRSHSFWHVGFHGGK